MILTCCTLEGANRMKKLCTLSLALLLLLTLTFATASAERYTAGSYYTIDYPDTLTLDDTTYTDETTTDYTWLFLLDGDTYLIDAALTPAEGYEGVSLYSASEADQKAYVQDTLEAYNGYGIQLADAIVVNGSIPFYIFSMDEGDGPYYFAETIANGTSINFSCYYDDAETALDAALLSEFETVLKTFKPIGAQ